MAFFKRQKRRKVFAFEDEVLESLGQIVWAINPRNDTLPALVGTLREHTSRTLDAHALNGRLHFPPTVPERPVSAEFRRAVFLVLKEALHNVIKHAQATTVTVSLAVTPDGLTLTVADDGRGFALHEGDGAPRMIGGNGLGNMERRAEELGGRLTTDGSGRGTTVCLEAPFLPTVRSPDDVTRRHRQPV